MLIEFDKIFSKMKPIIQYHENGIVFFMFNVDRIRLLNNKFRGLSPSGGVASLSFDQGVPKKLLTTAPSSQSERQSPSDSILQETFDQQHSL